MSVSPTHRTKPLALLYLRCARERVGRTEKEYGHELGGTKANERGSSCR